MKTRFIVPIISAALGLCVIACTSQEIAQVESAISPVGACVVNIIDAANGTEDPALIASTCQTSIVDVYQIVMELLGHDPTDASTPTALMVSTRRTHLTNIKTRALNLMHDAGVVIPVVP